MELLERSLKHAFIDQTIPGSTYDTTLIINQPDKQQFLLNTLQAEVEQCSHFFFSVAFITQSGLNSIKAQLSDLAKKGVTGRLVTSTYLNFNDPLMFESLLNIPNLEVRLSKKPGFHAKGYLFEKEAFHTLIIGSSNLTMNALKENYEWNLRLTSFESGELIHQVRQAMTEEWRESTPLTKEWIDTYKETHLPVSFTPSILNEEKLDYIAPNMMQKKALTNLKTIREEGKKRALVISATGTGKTYLAAFDVLQAKPRRMLFIVHREQILNTAKESFKKIIGGADSDFGILSGTKKEINAKYLFATIQTISKEQIKQDFAPDYFDYILIDEVHRAGATSYTKVIDYFSPNFLLGMTATPERTDGFNIFELFDYNTAYEIRLKDALEENLLCPFHYFGVTDFEYQGEVISETTELYHLTDTERVKFLIDKITYYGHSGSQVKGLVFCSQVREAKELAHLFTKQGLPSAYLSGEDSMKTREDTIQQLEKGSIKYIFTVDIFNEGIDIPMINQVIMLRNTQSNIIFIQQLGRGLRKYPNKEFVTVIDFIGNYKNNYMIPMALSGDDSLNKNNLRKDTFDTNYISGLSAINFESIAKERIFESIDAAKLDSMAMLKQLYFSLKNRLNRTPTLFDYFEQNWVDPVMMASKSKNYYDFLVKIKEETDTLSENDTSFLNFVTAELLPGIRPHDLIILNELLHIKKHISKQDIVDYLKEYNLNTNSETIDSVIRTLSTQFYVGSQKKSYEQAAFINEEGQLTPHFLLARENPVFVRYLHDLIKTGLALSFTHYTKQPLTLYQKYRRRDVLRVLNWKKQMVDQNIGGYTRNDDHFVIFVTLEKGEDFKGSLVAYEDALLDPQTILWFSKAPRNLNSPEVTFLREHGQDIPVHFFIKKHDDHGTDFYYLGQVKPDIASFTQEEITISSDKKKSLVKMILKLDTPIQYSLFDFLNH